MKITKYEHLDIIDVKRDPSGYCLIDDVFKALEEALDNGATLCDIECVKLIKVREETDDEYQARTSSQAEQDRESLRYHSYKVRELQKKLGL